MTNDALLRLGFGLALLVIGLYATLRRKISVRQQRRTASGENRGSRDFTLEGGPAVLLGLTSLVSGAMFAAPVAIAWLQAEHPEFVREHPKAFYRTLSKQHIRLGRELLAQGGGDRRRIAEARTHLRQAIRAYPYSRRPYIYLLAALISPGTYAAWRRWEVRFAKLRSAPPAA